MATEIAGVIWKDCKPVLCESVSLLANCTYVAENVYYIVYVTYVSLIHDDSL